MTSVPSPRGAFRLSWRVRAAGVVFLVALWLLFVADGSRQPTSAHTWRLLGYQRAVAGASPVVQIDDAAGLEAAWRELLLTGEPPTAGDAAVYWLTAHGTIACPSHLADVTIDAAAHRVTGVFTLALTTGCDASRVPDSFLVAIDRAALPALPFDVTVADSK